jgi:serine/threonine protein phosphatase PrpC
MEWLMNSDILAQVRGYTDQGTRVSNEDCISIHQLESGILCLVADGLGGQGGGDLASNCAVSAIESYTRNLKITQEILGAAIEIANKKVYAQQSEKDKMMTTIAALWIPKMGGEGIVASVGDSRIYQFRDREIVFQSTDHSVAQIAVSVGEINPSEMRSYPKRNKLTRALGAESDVKIDCETVNVMSGDRFLICTDGFWELVTEERMILSIASTGNVQSWLEEMRKDITNARDRRKDNNSAIAIIIE